MSKQTVEERVGMIEFDDKKDFFYSYNMIFDLELSSSAKLLYLYLCRKADSDDKSFPSYATMGMACSISRRTAMRALKELMLEGLLIKVRRANGNEQTSNVYKLYPTPQERLKETNRVQLKRELKEYHEMRLKKQNDEMALDGGDTESLQNKAKQCTNTMSIQCGDTQSPQNGLKQCGNETVMQPGNIEILEGGDRMSLRSGDTQSLPLHGDNMTLGGDNESLGGDCMSLEVQPIEVQPIEVSSSSPNETVARTELFDIPEISTEILTVIQKAYESAFNSRAKKISIGDTKIPTEQVRNVLLGLHTVHIKQVARYITQNQVKSLTAIKSALYNSPTYVTLEKVRGIDTDKKENQNRFHNFSQRNYPKEFFEQLEKKLVCR